jgi:predicted transcriptional regulator
MAKKNNLDVGGDPKKSRISISKKLLGELEAEIMEYMWDIEQARVQTVFRLINRQRPLAYTAVMTAMGHLAQKRLLTRTSEGNTYVYQVAQTKEDFPRNTSKNEAKESQSLIPIKLLGELEAEIMEHMWDIGQARVRHIFRLIDNKRPIAYTTVMTVMGHLVKKGLLTRTSEGNRYIYKVARTKDEFLRNTHFYGFLPGQDNGFIYVRQTQGNQMESQTISGLTHP